MFVGLTSHSAAYGHLFFILSAREIQSRIGSKEEIEMPADSEEIADFLVEAYLNSIARRKAAGRFKSLYTSPKELSRDLKALRRGIVQLQELGEGTEPDDAESIIKSIDEAISALAVSFMTTPRPSQRLLHHRRKNLLGGYPFTSERYPWPRIPEPFSDIVELAADGLPLLPTIQVDLDVLSEVAAHRLGNGVLQIWTNNCWQYYQRVIPRRHFDTATLLPPPDDLSNVSWNSSPLGWSSSNNCPYPDQCFLLSKWRNVGVLVAKLLHDTGIDCSLPEVVESLSGESKKSAERILREDAREDGCSFEGRIIAFGWPFRDQLDYARELVPDGWRLLLDLGQKFGQGQVYYRKTKGGASSIKGPIVSPSRFWAGPVSVCEAQGIQFWGSNSFIH